MLFEQYNGWVVLGQRRADYKIFVSFVLRGLFWQLPSRSELPLEHCLLLLLDGVSFPSHVAEEPSFPIYFAFYEPFLLPCTSMSSSIYHCYYCIAVPRAQRNQPPQTRKASTCQSERNDASKQTELARASMSSSIYTTR